MNVPTPAFEIRVVLAMVREPSDKSRLATCPTVEFKSVSVLVAAPVISSVLFPPAQVKVAGLIVNVSVVASPRMVFPSTVKSPAIVVVPSETLPVSIMVLPYMSPSASTEYTTDPPTASPRRFESAVADAGLM